MLMSCRLIGRIEVVDGQVMCWGEDAQFYLLCRIFSAFLVVLLLSTYLCTRVILISALTGVRR